MHFKIWFIGNNVPENKWNLEVLSFSILHAYVNSNFTEVAAD